jgi:hypothetical protein
MLGQIPKDSLTVDWPVSSGRTYGLSSGLALLLDLWLRWRPCKNFLNFLRRLEDSNLCLSGLPSLVGNIIGFRNLLLPSTKSF